MTLDGEERGVTPIELSVPRGNEVVVVEVAKRGFLTRTLEVVPDRDGELDAALVAAPRASRRPPAGQRSAPAQPEGSPFRRFN